VLVIPAIDIKGGRCVRLYRGEMDKETIYFDDPVDAARRWVDEGAEMLHVVDLDGAIAGRPVHLDLVKSVCETFGVAVEFGGGLRSAEAVEAAFAAGVARVVIGTNAFLRPDFLRAAADRFEGKVVVGIDARDGRVAIKGWEEGTGMDAVELARRCEKDGASRIIYTDINRDGTASGPNIDETRRVARAVKIPVIASGGVSSLDDLRRLGGLAKEGIEGIVVGRALYSGAFSLKEAMAAARYG
jgi:phosphoribosylformimino-5-aminoimidazole carboxamide ribotide isomerase